MDIQKKLQEITQSRSNYQLQYFAIGQHDTPEMQYYQLIIEMNGVIESIKESQLQIKKIEAEIEELLETGKKSDAIEAQIKELKISSIEKHICGSQRELNFMQKLLDQYPDYSREDIENNQAEYWEKRLMRVAQLQAMGGGVNWAQLEAIHQAGLLEKVLTTGHPTDYLDVESFDVKELSQEDKNE